jgi:multidrug efflux system membrane fusion protein
VVKEGDLLAQIDPRPFEVMLKQAEGQMVRDRALLANARIDLERYQTLFKQDSIARQQVDTQAALVRQYEGTITADQSQIDNAKLQLAYARITAPISGRLGLRQVDPGNIVHSSDANGIVVITQLDPIAAIFTIPQDQLQLVLKRREAKLAVEAWDRENRNRLVSGTLITVDNQIDTTTGTVKLKAEFPNADGLLFPNQFVNIRMLVDTRKGATVVPGAAVQRGAQGLFVYVVKPDNSVTMRPVTLGPVDGQRQAIESGVAPGERVVVDGVDRLREGAKVEIAQRPAPEAAPPPVLEKKGRRQKGSG